MVSFFISYLLDVTQNRVQQLELNILYCSQLIFDILFYSQLNRMARLAYRNKCEYELILFLTNA